MQEEQKIYPSSTDTEGYFFETADDEASGIRSKVYENGSKTKSAFLKGIGKTATVRQLKAKESVKVRNVMGKDPEQYQMAVVTVATKFDDQQAIIEEVSELLFPDYSVLLTMCQDLNFT